MFSFQQKSYSRLAKRFARPAEEETITYVTEELSRMLGDEAPGADAVRSYLVHPRRKTTLTRQAQLLATDKLLEFAEINFRTCCDMLRYHTMRDAGLVDSVDEFIRLLQSGKSQKADP